MLKSVFAKQISRRISNAQNDLCRAASTFVVGNADKTDIVKLKYDRFEFCSTGDEEQDFNCNI